MKRREGFHILNSDCYYHVFQPIISNAKALPIGFEALLRHRVNKNPENMFRNARELNFLVELDLFSITLCIEKYSFLMNNNINVFINIFPTTIASPKFNQLLNYLEELNVKTLIFELNESNDDRDVWGSNLFLQNLRKLKDLEIKIAIDDVGKGQSTLQNIMTIQPDYIKLDRLFAQGLHHSKYKQQLISSFIGISQGINASLVLEGVEIKEEFIVAKQLGVPFVQGFFFGKPEILKEKQIINL